MSVITRLTSDAKIKANSFNAQQLAWDDTGVIEDTHTLDDTLIFDDSAELDTLITYLFDGNIPTLEDYIGDIILDEHGNIFADEFCTTQASYNETVVIDDTLILDENYEFTETKDTDIDILIKYVFGITSTLTPITKIQLHNNKIIFANEFVIGL